MPKPLLQARADTIHAIRAFFKARDVLEVETLLLCSHSVTDVHIQSFPVTINETQTRYLQTSPEFAMKRLLAAGSGPIYQITKAFRREEAGRFHNPEFSMLEWYRPGFSDQNLMDEIDALLQSLLKSAKAERQTYQSLFKTHLHIDPLNTDIESVQALAKQQGIHIDAELDLDDWLSLLLCECIEPKIAKTRPLFITDFPKSQAALAKLDPDNPKVAKRFELYFKGFELANGFEEATDSAELRARFTDDNCKRHALNLETMTLDERFLHALNTLPDCSGVALGIDRLIMLILGKTDLSEVMSFPFETI